LCAELPVVDEIVADPRWHAPLRLLGGVHYLALAEEIEPWEHLHCFLEERRDWLTRFVSEQGVQTNEVQRCWALLPAFLLLGEQPLDLLELGPSAGLNLLWDRYAYRYRTGEWGREDAPLVLSGKELSPVPAELLTLRPQVRRRRGIDLDPIDVSSEHGARLLECFVWADQPERLARLRHAIEVVRGDAPELTRGDYVELLPGLLRDRLPGTLTVVFQTASTGYLPLERYGELRQELAEAPRPLAWISTRMRFERDRDDDIGYELEVALWPERGPHLVARMGFHGEWVDWL
jgi:hypothetical protein